MPYIHIFYIKEHSLAREKTEKLLKYCQPKFNYCELLLIVANCQKNVKVRSDIMAWTNEQKEAIYTEGTNIKIGSLNFEDVIVLSQESDMLKIGKNKIEIETLHRHLS